MGKPNEGLFLQLNREPELGLVLVGARKFSFKGTVTPNEGQGLFKSDDELTSFWCRWSGSTILDLELKMGPVHFKNGLTIQNEGFGGELKGNQIKCWIDDVKLSLDFICDSIMLTKENESCTVKIQWDRVSWQHEHGKVPLTPLVALKGARMRGLVSFPGGGHSIALDEGFVTVTDHFDPKGFVLSAENWWNWFQGDMDIRDLKDLRDERRRVPSNDKTLAAQKLGVSSEFDVTQIKMIEAIDWRRVNSSSTNQTVHCDGNTVLYYSRDQLIGLCQSLGISVGRSERKKEILAEKLNGIKRQYDAVVKSRGPLRNCGICP